MHKVQHKDAVYPFACTSCEYNAPNQENLLAHLKIHSDEKPYPCHICSYRAKNRTGINAHLKRKNHAAIRSVRINYKCHLCNYQTSNPSDLRYHIVTHIRKPDLIRLELICMCRYVTKFEEIPIHINEHVKNTLHTEIDKLLVHFVCNIVSCGRDEQDENVYDTDAGTSSQGNALSIPVLHHSNVPSSLSYNSNINNYPRNIQGSSEAQNAWLQNDTGIMNLSSAQPPVVNNLPPIHTINGSNTLNINDPPQEHHYFNRSHQVTIPTELSLESSVKVTSDLTCMICNYVAYNDSDLNFHVSNHCTILYDRTCNMPIVYMCNICNFKGSDENELMLHMATHVTFKYDNTQDVIDFTCNACGYSTFSQADLEMHVLSHEPQECIRCERCAYTSSSDVELRLHTMMHTTSNEPVENIVDSDPDEAEPSYLMNSYNQQDFYGNRQPFAESGLPNHQEQYAATLHNHI